MAACQACVIQADQRLLVAATTLANRNRVTVAPWPTGALLRCRRVVVGTTVGQRLACQLFFAELGCILQS